MPYLVPLHGVDKHLLDFDLGRKLDVQLDPVLGLLAVAIIGGANVGPTVVPVDILERQLGALHLLTTIGHFLALEKHYAYISDHLRIGECVRNIPLETR